MTNANSRFKALADPTRRKVLRMLARGDMTAGAIADEFEMTKPSVSHHLGVLKQADLVIDERRGQHIVYSLNTTVFQDVLAWAMDVATDGGRQGATAKAPGPARRKEEK